ncbi:LysR family transcriptional regulator [Rouxiella badensis]|jgi:DNA-binding transcriptional LysR family regulator|uniref:LysR family transcriptional regulator n=1 Tax=Rouxiella badensis TaxID=1646377 RepID=A0A1X0WHR5_9GAMM|nr:LysR family transcriptional regulator [Rouxiella badensis]MCC3718469.1 LysR family transcriptional regulator [Rouxiella badensis]MCC3726763.1 LysR family transcriptional regulator [Rouxiella badensis]MCC3738888.1 LysR family transcriptional regulator [Rouxiella badensis]ORJ26261.1 LysR family transcriptional regulator [Rouxiella badensis]QII37640.1 LysR family transcriptional regulator [Rouxiella badensis]
MRNGDFSDIAAFIAVAEEGSFTRAAAKLGLSQSALSYAVRMLEQRLETRLISRTTRSLSLTDAGERFFQTLKPALESINNQIDTLKTLHNRPAGNLRITTFKHAAQTVLFPALSAFMAEYPDITVEIDVNEGLADIVAERFDAGIRFGEQVEKDMVAVRVGPDIRMAVVATPDYFARYAPPQTPRELGEHRCIRYRQKTAGGLFAWEFRKGESALDVKVDGALIVNDSNMLEDAALKGLGLVYIYESQIVEHVAEGRLVRVLEDWCEPLPGYHLYYPSRKQHTPAFSLLLDRLRYRPHG